MSILVLWPLATLERTIVEPLIPVYRAVLRALDDRFEVEQVDVIRVSGSDRLHFGVNLTVPTSIAGKTVYPFGWNSVPAGGFMPGGEPMPRGGSVPKGEYQADYPLSGLLSYAALSLIAALAWPAAGVKEIAYRLLAIVPFWVAFHLIDVPAFVLCVLDGVLQDKLDPQGFYGWIVWRRFLVDGGGVMLAMLVAGGAIAFARAQSLEPRQPVGQARQKVGIFGTEEHETTQQR